MKSFGILLFSLLLSTCAFAQGEYLGRGNYGFEVGASVTTITTTQNNYFYSQKSSTDYTSPFVSFSFNGTFDLGVVHLSGGGKTGQSIVSTLHLLNSHTVPFKISAAGQMSFFEGDTETAFSPIAHFDIELSQKLFIKFKAMTSFSSAEENPSYLGLSLYNRSNPVMFVFSAGQQSIDGDTNTLYGFSIVFPTSLLTNGKKSDTSYQL